MEEGVSSHGLCLVCLQPLLQAWGIAEEERTFEDQQIPMTVSA